ncbi:hypothetical protein TDB9533_04705 [Thalassocella blandensis]|nr:hypothetical protein TDB9533_04705 [Thalassocella blandensis]
MTYPTEFIDNKNIQHSSNINIDKKSFKENHTRKSIRQKSDVSWFYRAQVAARVIAAAFGGYALTASFSTLLALSLPLPAVLAVSISSMLSFTLYTIIIIACFSVRRVSVLWGGLILALFITAGLNAWLLPLSFNEYISGS